MNATSQTKQEAQATPGELFSFDLFLREKGKTRSTGWRWRKQWAWFKIVNVMGRLYISRDTIREFERRAMAGELAGELFGRAANLAGGAR